MPEQGFEMIRGRRKQFVDMQNPVTDQTKSARKSARKSATASQIMKRHNIFEEDKSTQKKTKAKKPIQTRDARKEHPMKNVGSEDAPQVFNSPERNQDVPKPYEKRLQKADMNSLVAIRYRALKNACDTLLALMDRDEDSTSIEEQMEIADVVEKQTEIVEKLRIIWNKAVINNAEEGYNSHIARDEDATGYQVTGGETRKTTQRRATTRTQSPSPVLSLENVSRRSTTPPPRKRLKKSKKYSPPPPSPNIAFPASAPTTLPAELRTRKDISTEEIVKKTKVHSSFDESAGKKIDKHSRRINCTSGKGMVAGMMPKREESHRRTLEEQIRIPSDSPEPDISEL